MPIKHPAPGSNRESTSCATPTRIASDSSRVFPRGADLVGPKGRGAAGGRVKAGALGVGEVSKSFGMWPGRQTVHGLTVDEPMLDPFWAACARLGIPAFIHTAEPLEFFNEPGMHNERWLELSLFADRRNYQPEKVKFEQLMTERNNLFRKHPKTKFIAAHLGWHAHDLARASRCWMNFRMSMSNSAPCSTISAASRAPRTDYLP